MIAITPIILAAVTFPAPSSLGSASIICLAFDALTRAIGPRMNPKQNNPTMAYVNASFASLQGIVGSSTTIGCPFSAITLHEPQYFCP